MDYSVYESFRYIHPPPYEHNFAEVLENKYKTKESIEGKFVTYAPGIGYRK